MLPHSKIIGALHLANISAADIDTSLTLEFETAEPEEIEVALQPLSYLIYSVNIPAQMESRWRMTCPIENAYSALGDAKDDFAIYYVLGHYHSWGNDADKEMCMFLPYVGAPVKVVSWGSEPAEELGMVDGFRTFEAGCGTVIAFPAPQL
jgi:hypothetical protein